MVSLFRWCTLRRRWKFQSWTSLKKQGKRSGTLVRLAAEEHVLIHVEHHLVHDGWSFNVFLGELTALYNAFSAGRASPLPDPNIQFADYAVAHRAWVQEEVAAGQLAYWKS